MVKIVISFRTAYILAAVFVFALLGVGVYAITPGVVPNPGHLITSNIAPPSNCAGLLYFSGTSWYCTANVVPSCTGTNKYLQYSSSLNTWSCATLS